MTKPKEVHEWLKEDRPQLEWAKEYLRKKNIPVPMVDGYEAILGAVRRLDKESVRRMRLAWNQHGSKVKRQRKTCSFTLSISTRRKLKGLARKGSESSVLENLIERGHNLETEMRAEWKQTINEKLANLGKRRLYPGSLTPDEASDLRAERDALKAMVAELSLKCSRLEADLEKDGSHGSLTVASEAIEQEQPEQPELDGQSSTSTNTSIEKRSEGTVISSYLASMLEEDAARANLSASEHLEILIKRGLPDRMTKSVPKPGTEQTYSRKTFDFTDARDEATAPPRTRFLNEIPRPRKK